MPSNKKKGIHDKDSEEYILQKSQSKRFGITSILIVIVVIVTVIAVAGVLFDYW
ncbi:MAG: hypothetical protein WCD31_04240 [Gillisia sp.]